MSSHGVYSFRSAFQPLLSLWDSPTLFHLLIVRSFSLHSSIPFYRHTTDPLSILLLTEFFFLQFLAIVNKSCSEHSSTYHVVHICTLSVWYISWITWLYAMCIVNFWNKYFSKWPYHFTSPLAWQENSRLFHILFNTWELTPPFLWLQLAICWTFSPCASGLFLCLL